jgi:hypothetical protein
MALYRPLYVGAVPPVVVVSGLKVSVPAPKLEVNNCVGPCPEVKLLLLLVPWLRKFSGWVQLNGVGGSAAAGVVGVVVVAVDGDAAGVGAAAGNGVQKVRVPIAKPATSVTQTRDIPALRPSLSRRRW